AAGCSATGASIDSGADCTGASAACAEGIGPGSVAVRTTASSAGRFMARSALCHSSMSSVAWLAADVMLPPVISKRTGGRKRVGRLLPPSEAVQHCSRANSSGDARLAATRVLRLSVLVAVSLVGRSAGAVVPRFETPLAPGIGDSLDDVAIWIHPEDP